MDQRFIPAILLLSLVFTGAPRLAVGTPSTTSTADMASASAERFDAAFADSLRKGLGGTPDEARPEVERLEALVPEGDALRRRRFQATTCGVLHPRRRDALKEAETLLAAERAEASPDPTSLALLHLCRAAYQPSEQSDSARKDYDEAVVQARRSGDDLLLGSMLSARSGVMSVRGEYARALSDALEAQRLFERLGEHGPNGVVLQNAGIAYRRMGEYAQAEEYLRRSLDVPELSEDWVHRLISLLQLGYLYEETGRFSRAREVLRDALHLCTEKQSRNDCGYVRLALAGVEVNATSPERAMSLLDAAEADFEASGDPGDPAMLALLRGQALARLGRLEQALGLLDTAIAIWTKEKNDRYLALALPELTCRAIFGPVES
ncbi:tetratricopeptide repeat protein [Silanimonas lenta]|uniref:tetratricopeptide repeat protein n=1 Tax=Silanimonas lenta TaxID=265429 RepID=UPI002FE2A311